MIKKFSEFNSNDYDYSYSCVMLKLDILNWEKYTSSIKEEDLYIKEGENYGIQDNPHITILYGLTDETSLEDVKSVFNGIDSIEVEVDGIDIFENDDFDVVKFNIKKNEILQNLFDDLSNFPNNNTFPDYKPHITIAYVKKGEGFKYKRPFEAKLKLDKIIYSTSNGEEEFSLNEI